MLAAALAIAWAGIDAAATPSRASCAANIVRYQAAKHPTLHDAPWILARPAARGVLGFVVSYPQSLRDRRVNRSDGLVLWTCWQLRLGQATAVVRVVPRPTTLGCDATLLRTAGAFARPLSSGIRGGWGPWRTPKGGALLYTHGHGGGWNMKVLWRVLRHSDPGLTLTGIRLDGDGSFSQTFGMVFQGVFPSTVDVPAAGCWLFRLRTARLAGVLVVQAIDADG